MGLAASVENLPFTYSIPLPLLPLLTTYFVMYLLAWMESTVSLLVAFILYDIFDQLHRAWISFISIVICSHSFLVPSLVGLNSLNIGCLSMVTDYSVRLAVRRLHH